ncbi:hypothetical protein HRbin14_02198 [bacterium HR14]|nr:hypothetical protein HRbin14_02198 [bacterium HR14]
MRALALALALTLSGLAYASGRAACRVVQGPPTWGVCYVEQVVWREGPLELAGGLEWRTWPEAEVVAYTLLGLYLPSWWATLEVGRGSGWRWAVGVGIRW